MLSGLLISRREIFGLALLTLISIWFLGNPSFRCVDSSQSVLDNISSIFSFCGTPFVLGITFLFALLLRLLCFRRLALYFLAAACLFSFFRWANYWRFGSIESIVGLHFRAPKGNETLLDVLIATQHFGFLVFCLFAFFVFYSSYKQWRQKDVHANN
jgi:hypothetical protein